MTNAWLGDACSLVETLRAGAITPSEAVGESLAAIEKSSLNAFSFVDTDGARARAANADLSLPFGGVPVGVKELDAISGWPETEASLVFRDRIATYTSTWATRLVAAGANLVGLCTASEFGGLNISVTKLNGITRNPWNTEKTTGGSSAGSSAAVAGGLVPIASGGDGGGSIRIPAGFTGLLGMKGTAGRIPRGPHTHIAPLTVVLGCQARSVRDATRWYDVCSGHDRHDPYSLPKIEGWERDLGSHDLRGRKAVISPDLGSAVVRPEVAAMIAEHGELLAKDAGLDLVDVPVKMPQLSYEWAMSNLVTEWRKVKDLWPDCKDDLTEEMAFAFTMAKEVYDLDIAARVEEQRTDANELLAELFDRVDFVISATNPDVAFPAEVSVNTKVGDVQVGIENNGALTIPANVVGNPSVSVPIGTFEGLPVGMQVMGAHHTDPLLFDLALAVERERPWPLVAPRAPL